MSNLAAVSMAMLQTQFNKKMDYLDMFKSFVIEAIKSDLSSKIDIKNISTFIKLEFGIEIPQRVIEKIINRMHKEDYFVQIEHHNKYSLPKAEKFGDSSFKFLREDLIKKCDEFTIKLINFARDIYGKDWTEQNAIDEISNFLNQYDIEIIKSYVKKNSLSLPQYKQGSTLIISMFIIKQQKENPYLFNYFVDIVSGYILSRILYENDCEMKPLKLNETMIILDTTLLMPLLGYNGKEEKESFTELLNLLKKFKAQICCYKHDRDEVESLLSTVCSKLRSGDLNWSNPCFIYFLSMKFDLAYIDSLSISLDKDIAELGIRIIGVPSHNDFADEIDESKLAEQLSVRMSRDKTIKIDVCSVAATKRYRCGLTTKKIEKSKAIFISTNKFLVETSNLMIKEDIGYDKNIIPVCMTDCDLTVKLWLKDPVKFPDLPKKRVIADCYASLRPNEHDYTIFLKNLDTLLEQKKIDLEDVYNYKCCVETQYAYLEIQLRYNEPPTEEKQIFEILNRTDQMKKQEIEIRDSIIAKQTNEINILKNKIEQREMKKRIIVEYSSKIIMIIFKILICVILFFPHIIIYLKLDNDSLKWILIAITSLIYIYFIADLLFDLNFKVRSKMKTCECRIATFLYKMMI